MKSSPIMQSTSTNSFPIVESNYYQRAASWLGGGHCVWNTYTGTSATRVAAETNPLSLSETQRSYVRATAQTGSPLIE